MSERQFTASECIGVNARRLRAKALAAQIIQEIEPFLSTEHGVNSEAFCALWDVLAQNGAAFTTDEEREAMGLEARDPMGWTPSERIARKQRELEMLDALSRITFLPKL